MILRLQNFKCWEDKEFNFGTEGITLISGKSGKGKSSAIEAIYFALFGVGTKIVSDGKTSCKVELILDGMKIVRTKRPNRVVIDDKYEDEPAQEIINKKFSKVFETAGYMKQNSNKSFILKSPAEKLEFLETFAFQDTNLPKIRTRSKELIREREQILRDIHTNIDITKEVFSEKENPETVKFPLKCAKDKRKTIGKNVEKKYKNTEKGINNLLKKIDKLQEQINTIKIFENTQEIKLEELSRLNSKIESYEEELESDDEIENIKLPLKKYKRKLSDLIKLREFKNLEKQYIIDKEEYETLLETETRLRDEKLKKIEKTLWTEENEDDCKENIDVYKSLLEDLKEFEKLNDELTNTEIDETDFDEEIEEIEDKLDKAKNLLSKLKLSSGILKCPKCKSLCKIEEDNQSSGVVLILSKEKSLPKGNIEKVEKEIGELTKDKKQKKFKSSSQNKNKERHDWLSTRIDEIKEGYEDFGDNNLSQVSKELAHLKKYLSDNKEKELSQKHIQNSLDNNNTLQGLKRKITLQKSKIDNFSCEVEEDNEEDIRDKIKVLEGKREKFSQILSDLDELKLEKKNCESIMNAKEREIIKKYTKLEESTTLEKLLVQYKKDLESLEEDKQRHSSILEKIEEYFTFMKLKNEYDTWHEKLTKLEKGEKVAYNDLNSASLLKELIAKAESKAISNIISSINSHAQVYLDEFFVDNPIIVKLSPYKEVKKQKKSQIDVSIEYKGMECDMSTLSGGETQRVNLAFTLALSEMFNIPIMLLDECTSNLDQELTTVVIHGIKNNYHGDIVLLIAHQVISGIFDKHIKL